MDSQQVKVYFAGSITGDRSFAGMFKEIIAAIQASNARVLTEHFALDNPNAHLAEFLGKKYEELTPEDIERQDTAWINEATHVVAEISSPSTGTGREIEYARSKHLYGNIPAEILCLYHKDSKPSKMITGMGDRYPNVRVVGYGSADEMREIVKKFFEDKKKHESAPK